MYFHSPVSPLENTFGRSIPHTGLQEHSFNLQITQHLEQGFHKTLHTRQHKYINIRLSSALNKDSLVCSGTTPTVTHLLKKVNQAIDAWSFRQV